MIIIKIPTLSDIRLLFNKEANRRTHENERKIIKLKEKVLYHINREPTPEENKKYLVSHILREFKNVSLYPVWGKPKSEESE
jgi:hypothetical protein